MTHGGMGEEMLSQLASAGVACCRSLAAKTEIPIRFGSMGFPYGTLRVDEKLKSVQRVFQGYVVCRIIA